MEESEELQSLLMKVKEESEKAGLKLNVQTAKMIQSHHFMANKWGNTLEKEMATHSSILAWRIPMDRGAWWAIVHGVVKSQT